MNKRPVIVCTDPGIDDFIALCMLMHREELDLLGLISLSGNVGLDITVNNALVAAELCGREDIPVLAGSAKPLARPARSACNIHGASGLGKSVERYSARKPAPDDAADFICRMARRYPGELELVSLGPLTDVALALRKDPDIAGKIKNILVMGGGIRRGNATPFAEFNIVADPEAAAVVFASGAPVTMVGLDATHQCVMPRSEISRLASGSDLGRMVPAMLNDYTDIYKSVHRIDGMIIHDAICVVWLWHPEWFGCHRWNVRICLDKNEHLGQTVADETGTGACTVVMDTDAEKVNEEILSMMEKIVRE